MFPKNRVGLPQIIKFWSCCPLFSPSILGVKSPYFWFNTQIGDEDKKCFKPPPRLYIESPPGDLKKQQHEIRGNTQIGVAYFWWFTTPALICQGTEDPGKRHLKPGTLTTASSSGDSDGFYRVSLPPMVLIGKKNTSIGWTWWNPMNCKRKNMKHTNQLNF